MGQGLVGGAVSALTLELMHGLQHAIWHRVDARWLIPVVIMVGGGLLAVLHRWASDIGVVEQVAELLGLAPESVDPRYGQD